MGGGPVHPEITGEREPEYSAWRRQFGDNPRRRHCYVNNISWVEWRRGGPAAIIETTAVTGSAPTLEAALGRWRNMQRGLQYDLIQHFAQAVGIHAYAVSWTGDLEHRGQDVRFRVWKLTANQQVEMTLEEYEAFIERLPDDTQSFP